MDWLIEAAGYYSALTLLGITEAGRHPLVGAVANLTTLFCGFILVLQLTRLMKGDSKVLQRIDGSIKTIVERYETELTGHKSEIAELRASLEAIRATAVDGTARVETVQAALADLAQHGDPAKADVILAAIEARATDAAAPHRAEAAEAARHRGALAYWTNTLAALDHFLRAASLDPDHIWTWN